MANVFRLPDVGEGIAEGTIIEWLVSEGETIEVDQPVVKVETDKAVVELPSPDAGVVLRLHAAVGETVAVGAPLVSVGEAGEKPTEVPAVEEDSREARQDVSEEKGPGAASVVRGGPARRSLATPRTRRRARELEVDLETVRGTGPGGRITDDDVESAAQGAPVHAQVSVPETQPTAAVSGTLETTIDGPVERVPASHLRRVIAAAMERSWQRHVHVTHVDEADVTEIVALRESARGPVGERHGTRLTLLPYFVKAVVAALRAHPEFNAVADEERGELVLKRFYNIGIAVDTPEGLIVPVVKGADRKSLVELAAEISDLAERARERRLSLDELKGGTCTVTNIGPLGGLFATPIINGDELAIVGLHTIQERPVVRDGEVAIRKMMHLSVSFDHRWIDGAQAARFMTDLVQLIENPGLLTAEL